MGIAPDVLPQLFSLYTQGHHSLARVEGGLGVGLNVVQDIVQLHGGSVAISSPGLGHGCMVRVALPLAATLAPPRALPPAARACVRPKRILVVEDNDDARAVLVQLLALDAHHVDAAADGLDGVAMARAGDYDVMICDIGLPGLSGYEVIVAVRAEARLANLYAIAMSGYGQEQFRLRALASGFNAYLVKPVDVATLRGLIAGAGQRG
jgi:CheY-like chemotaxis protein